MPAHVLIDLDGETAEWVAMPDSEVVAMQFGQ
jgi:hypothetical protein